MNMNRDSFSLSDLLDLWIGDGYNKVWNAPDESLFVPSQHTVVNCVNHKQELSQETIAVLQKHFNEHNVVQVWLWSRPCPVQDCSMLCVVM